MLQKPPLLKPPFLGSGRIHENTLNSRTGLRIGLSLVWFARATPLALVPEHSRSPWMLFEFRRGKLREELRKAFQWGSTAASNPRPRKVTLPALQKHFVNIFFVFAWEFCIEKWRGFFCEFFQVSVSHKTKHEKSSKNSGKFGAKFRAKFGTKILKIRGTFGLQLF